VIRDRRPGEAIGHYLRAIEISEGLLRESPGDLSTQRDLANHRSGLAYALANLAQFDAAREQAQAAVDMQRAILRISMDNVVVREDMVDAQIALGKVWLAQNKAEAALRPLNESLWTARLLVEKDRAGLYSQRCLAMVSKHLGDCHAALGNAAEARRWYNDALAVWSQWKQANLARPFADIQEQIVLRARSGVPR
jgi:tetratricopeptide (TPR) repeat protein